MELTDKIVFTNESIETKDSAGRAVRTPVVTDEMVFINDMWSVTSTSSHLERAGFYGRDDGTDHYSTLPHWYKREVLRLSKHYVRTEVTDWLNVVICRGVCVHVSSQGNDMVAYTPSVEAGNADKQLVTTIGKFIRKFLLVMSDKGVADKVASHMAEMTGTFEVATTATEIQRIYTTMEGDNGCMRHTSEKWYRGTNVHPSAVYEAPSVGVAYTTDSTGQVKSRSVIYTNGDDKRFVRVYGDATLKKMLVRKGYKEKSLLGVKLKKIALPEKDYGEFMYVMPYLDGPGGNQSDYDCCVMDAGEYMEVASMTMRDKIGDRYVKNTKDYTVARVLVYPMPDMKWVSTFSGITYDVRENDGTRFRYIGAYGLGSASPSEITMMFPNGWNTAKTKIEGKTTEVVIEYGVKRIYYSGQYWLESDEIRKELGYKRLTFGANAGQWSKDVYTAKDRLGRVQLCGSDTKLAYVVDKEGEAHSFILTEVAFMATRREYVKTARYRSREVFCHKSCPRLTLAHGGIKFVMDLHTGFVKHSFTDEWLSPGQVQNVAVWGNTYSVSMDEIGTVAGKALVTLDVVASWKSFAENADNMPVSGITSDTLGAVRREFDRQAVELVMGQIGWKYLYMAGTRLETNYDTPPTLQDLINNTSAVDAYMSDPDKVAREGSTTRSRVAPQSKYVNMVAEQFLPVEAVLKATIDRLEREAAGQTVIETEGETA